jgi:radical SAM superfamily enzyme YgiQ (UPF0313 family)
MNGIIFTGFVPAPVTRKATFKRTAGGHRIASYLRNKGWDIEVVDFVLGWTLEELKEFSKSRVTDKTIWVGFGGTFAIWSETLENFFSWFKQTYPGIKIIAGGQIANLYKINADWYIDGFGERALEALLNHICGNSKEKLKFQIFSNGRKIIKGNLDYPSFPMPSLKIKYQDRDFILPTETLTTELGRGCIFNCTFCNFPILGVTEDHTRSGEDFYEELQDTYDRYGVTSYTLADETVNDYTEKIEKFANAVGKMNFKPTMYGFARADLFVSRPQDWDIMLKMGFIGHHYGIESTNHKSLKAVGKGMDPEKLLTKLLDAKQYFRKHGSYKGQISLIAGLPFETHETLEKTLKWTRDNWSTENTLLFPLYIPLENGGDAKSKLSIDWKKWGYKQSSIDYKDIIKKEYLGSRVNTQYGVGDGLIEDYIGMSWENSEWNILDVYKIVSDFYQPDVYNQFNGPVIWGMGEWQTVLKKPFEFFLDKTINQVVKDFNTNNGWIVMREGSFNMVRDYVNKKLNWKQK